MCRIKAPDSKVDVAVKNAKVNPVLIWKKKSC